MHFLVVYFYSKGTGFFTGRTTDPIPAFVCSAGEFIELEELCDGIAHCSGGDDETTPLCESMLLFLLVTIPNLLDCSYSTAL